MDDWHYGYLGFVRERSRGREGEGRGGRNPEKRGQKQDKREA
jgi:hypothetical protein